MLQPPSPKLRDDHAINTKVGDLRELFAELERLTNAGLSAAYGETNATDEASEWFELADAQSAEIKRLRAELAAVLPWAQTMYNMIPDLTTIDEELAYTLTEMQEAAPAVVRQPGETIHISPVSSAIAAQMLEQSLAQGKSIEILALGVVIQPTIGSDTTGAGSVGEQG